VEAFVAVDHGELTYWGQRINIEERSGDAWGYRPPEGQGERNRVPRHRVSATAERFA
jgi:hypothetical protein